MADYNNYSIAAEEQLICVRKPSPTKEQQLGPLWQKKGTDTVLCLSMQHTSWEFTIKTEGPWVSCVDVKNLHKAQDNDNTTIVAEILMWQWDYSNNQKIVEKVLCNENENRRVVSSYLESDEHLIIRLLGKRKLVDDVCRPLAYLASDAFAISVAECTFVVSVQRMMQISPVFREELLAREKTSGKKAEVKDAEPEHFRAFLEVVDHEPNNVRPNPTNVVGVLKLAHRFRATLALDRCEEHLLNCVEIPLIERLQLADTYGLAKLKESILSIGSVKLRPFYQSNSSTLHQEGLFSRKLLDELALRLCKND